MKKQGKFIKTVSVLALVACVTLSFAVTSYVANASETQTTVVEDAFHEVDTSTWNSNTNRISGGYKDDWYFSTRLHMDQYVFGTQVIHNLQSLQLDVMFENGHDWSSIWFHNDTTKASDGTPDLAKAMHNYDSAQMAVIQPNSIKSWNGGASYSGAKDWGFTAYKWYTLKYVFTGTNTFTIAYCEKGATLPETAQISATVSRTGVDFTQDTFIAFAAATKTAMNYDNIHVVADGVDVLETFEGETLNPLFREVTNDESTYNLAQHSTPVQMAKSRIGDSLISTVGADKEENVVTDVNVLKSSISIVFDETQNDEMSYVMGVKNTANVTDSALMLKMKKDSASVVYSLNGKETSVIESFAVTDYKSLNVNLNKNGKVSVYQGESLLGEGTCAVENYYVGKFGFYAHKDNEGNITLNTIKVSVGSFNVPYTKNLSHAFNNDFFGNKDDEGNDLQQDYIIKIAEGTGSIEHDAERGEMVFENLHNLSAFAINYTYENFVIEFKVTSIDEAKLPNGDGWLGVSFGAGTPTASYTSCNLFIIKLRRGKESHGTIGWPHMPKGAKVTKNESLSDLFNDITYRSDTNESRDDIKAEDAVCFKMVVEDGVVSIYAKKASDLKYVLVNQAIGFDGNTFGYVRLQGYYSNFTVDDLSMTNTSEYYVLADNIAPETKGERIVEVEKIIYDRANIDQNALDEIDFNVKDGGNTTTGGCSGSITSSIIPIVFGLISVSVVLCARKRKGSEK